MIRGVRVVRGSALCSIQQQSESSLSHLLKILLMCPKTLNVHMYVDVVWRDHTKSSWASLSLGVRLSRRVRPLARGPGPGARGPGPGARSLGPGGRGPLGGQGQKGNGKEDKIKEMREVGDGKAKRIRAKWMTRGKKEK